jgi:glycosyltransferase involved in cell wall biosynthesis
LKQKRVLIDCRKLSNLNSGLGQFCFHLGKNLVLHCTSEIKLVFLVPQNYHGIFGPTSDYCFPINVNSIPEKIDLIHLTHQQANLEINSAEKVFTVHDLNFLFKYGILKRNYQKYLLRKRLKYASMIAFISEFTATIFFEHINYPEEKTKIIYNGLCIPDEVNEPMKLKEKAPFFLSLGIISEKKNIGSLIPLMKFFPEMNLVIAGNNESVYAQKLIKQVDELSLSKRITFTGEVNDAEKVWLLKNCMAFFFPSISEGFGLPLIEAFYFGKPVFCSNKTSLPEIGGKLAYYWDSFEPQLMAELVRTGLESWDVQKQKAVVERANFFSWEKASKSYLNLYRQILFR